MKNIFLYSCLSLSLLACKQEKKPQKAEQKITAAVAKKTEEKTQDSIVVMPVEHASFAMKLNDKTFYVDPVGEIENYTALPKPDLIFVTDIHGDHMSAKTLLAFTKKDATLKIVGPQAVKEQLPKSLQNRLVVMNNNDEKSFLGVQVKAIPMYNLREEAKDFHVKGRGNGYVLTHNSKKIYISGDTEDIPEMRNLKNIDLAFVCMNLPYTMPVDAAADAVLEFKPKKVYPYHYRGKNGMSDVAKFKNIVNTNNPSIEVEILDWY
ncbi:MBL fold metallo-hydrolase [Mesonia aestuariivivens]|uniref:MBL fold metallo-hydrolase n=1 Tax=Mesonia aestuariivivens TaxID=2796128 RepID=A0ABS6W2F5_9FLAO|nr:MBL fold metallo-hydrolase [Mesonia aestuariivivens]MBW2962037.1 MBL fold metallo-hydrolase [Mesonia aestuariivivens]